jgi:hypothetical protein
MSTNDPVNGGRFRTRDHHGGAVSWAVGAVAAVFVLGLVVWGMSGPTRNNPPPQTTGQGNPPPVSPNTPNLPAR